MREHFLARGYIDCIEMLQWRTSGRLLISHRQTIAADGGTIPHNKVRITNGTNKIR